MGIVLNEQLINSANITVEVEGEDFDILARPASIVQIFDNLVHNACVWLDGWRSSRQLTITLNHVARTVAITDTGPGIPPHMREHIFKPFISLRNGGRGLGLYITHELLRAMQGSILLDADYSRGARFILQFPALDKIAPGSRLVPTRERRHVLLMILCLARRSWLVDTLLILTPGLCSHAAPCHVPASFHPHFL